MQQYGQALTMVTRSSESEVLLRSAIIAAVLATVVISPAKAAQYRHEATVPNVPDRQGCVRLCEFDLNPCDTPLEKKLDGRCTRKD